MTALPDLKFFTDVPYSEDWKNEFKDFIQGLKDPNDALYYLNHYTRHLKNIKDKENLKSKGIQLANRLHELKRKVFLHQTKIPESDIIDKVGTVVVRSDNKALFTTIEKDSAIKYGFPKGQYEYIVTNPSDIHTVRGEGLAAGSLRELYEETGFKFKGKINVAKDSYTGILERTMDGKKDILPILGGSYKMIGNGYYLVLYVESSENLTSNDVPPNDENITTIVWENQYTEASSRSYNSFSKHRFDFPEPEFFDVENNANAGNTHSANIALRRKRRNSRKKAKAPNASTPRKRSKSMKRPRAHSK
jgi:hypothetical protein